MQWKKHIRKPIASKRGARRRKANRVKAIKGPNSMAQHGREGVSMISNIHIQLTLAVSARAKNRALLLPFYAIVSPPFLNKITTYIHHP